MKYLFIGCVFTFLTGCSVQLSKEAPKELIAAVKNTTQITGCPYKWGGGHKSFSDWGYDCSGSVSYFLASAGALNSPASSTELMRWGIPGEGQFATVYAKPGHAFMHVGNVRLDTSRINDSNGEGPRWRSNHRNTDGFVARTMPGW